MENNKTFTKKKRERTKNKENDQEKCQAMLDKKESDIKSSIKFYQLQLMAIETDYNLILNSNEDYRETLSSLKSKLEEINNEVFSKKYYEKGIDVRLSILEKNSSCVIEDLGEILAGISTLERTLKQKKHNNEDSILLENNKLKDLASPPRLAGTATATACNIENPANVVKCKGCKRPFNNGGDGWKKTCVFCYAKKNGSLINCIDCGKKNYVWKGPKYCLDCYTKHNGVEKTCTQCSKKYYITHKYDSAKVNKSCVDCRYKTDGVTIKCKGYKGFKCGVNVMIFKDEVEWRKQCYDCWLYKK